jgi:hypothetical protein
MEAETNFLFIYKQMASRNFAPILQEGDSHSNGKFRTFARHSPPCNPPLEKMNPHPSETTPRVPCHQYYPMYCRKNKKKVCVLPDNSKVMVHLAKNGDIEKVALSKNEHLIRKDYSWSRIPPLQAPLSNNIPVFISENAWDPHCSKLNQES